MAVFRKTEEVKPVSSFQETSSRESEKSKSFIGKTLFIKGELNSSEEVNIEGRVEGKLNVQNRVVVDVNGQVSADIVAREITIKGHVNGNVKGGYKVEIVPGGVLNGNIVSPKVVLAEGAIFKGNIDMSTESDKKKIDTDDKKGEKKEEGAVSTIPKK